MRRFALLSALAAVFVLVPATAFAQQAETPRLEQIVPDHTFLTVSLNDLGAARAQFSRTALAKLWREEEVQQFVGPAMEMIGAQIQQMEKQFGHPVMGILDSLRGQVALAVVEFDPMFGGLVPDLVVVADLGEGRAAFEALHREAIAKMGENLNLKDLEYGGIAYQRIVAPQGLQLFFGYIGNALVITMRPERMPAVIDAHQKGLENALAASPTYRAVVEGAGGADALMQVFFNAESVLGYFGDRMDPQVTRVIDAMGLNGVKGVGLGTKFVKEGVRDTVFVYAPGEKKGLMGLPYASAGDGTRLLARVPESAFYASSGRASLFKIWKGVLSMVGEVEPFALDQMMGGVSQAEEFLGLSLENDLLKPLGEEMAVYMAMPDGGGVIPDLVFMARLDEPERFMNSLGQIVTRVGMMVEDSGQYSVELRSMTYEGKVIHYVHVVSNWGDPFPITPSVTLDGDLMVMALYPQVLKDFVARPKDAPSILARPDFQRVRQGLPARLQSIEYMDYQAAMRQVYGTLVPVAQLLVKQEQIPVDMALLPRTETIARHLFGGAGGLELRDDGMAVHAYTPMGIVPLMMVSMAPAMLLGFSQSRGMRVMEIPPMPRPSEPTAPAGGNTPRGQMEEIYIGLLFHYAQSDSYPKDLGELLKSQALDSAAVLVLPGDDSPLKTATGHPTSFVYMGPKVGQILEHQDEVVWVVQRDGLSKDGRWVLFASGKVEKVPEERLKALIETTRKLVDK